MRMASLPPLVIAGCSGAGKGTLIGKMMEWDKHAFGFSVSHTTRQPRPGEVDGTHYHFTDVETMKLEIDAGMFIESAHVHGNYYGTSKAAVEAVQKEGKICVLDIDVQGVQKVKLCEDLEPKFLWVEAPNLEVLEERLRSRGTETEEKIQRRLGNAKAELAYAHPADPSRRPFDAYLVNDDLDSAFRELTDLLYEWYPHLQPDGAVTAGQKGPCAVVTNLIARTPCFVQSGSKKRGG
uniref:guanylate kinase n=1 Tax=Chrysocystis fragilis TaxID=1411660 RepID=A0A7S0TAJ7_9STRA|mmetsp:Transcript_287/g.861  ORF Transcript_287/g.861 Transcript_287/m.861 type:complete len:237 (+) Transcript_287:84-794(+)